MKGSLGQKIGEGHYRDCYAINNTNLCVKKIKKNFRTILMFVLDRDINQEEFNIYHSLPTDLQEFFPYMHLDGSLLVSERLKDFDGNYSKVLSTYDYISNDSFWQSIDYIAHTMEQHKLWFFDIFHLGNNIVVQKISEDVYKPIIIDCKRVGWSSYPLQLYLLLDSEKEKKFRRRLTRFKQKYKR